MYSGVFDAYADQLKEIIENPEPETLPPDTLRRARLLTEEEQFDVDHYLSDYVEDDEQLVGCLRYKPIWIQEYQSMKQQFEQHQAMLKQQQQQQSTARASTSMAIDDQTTSSIATPAAAADIAAVTTTTSSSTSSTTAPPAKPTAPLLNLAKFPFRFMQFTDDQQRMMTALRNRECKT
jgi:hypothetical protein